MEDLTTFIEKTNPNSALSPSAKSLNKADTPPKKVTPSKKAEKAIASTQKDIIELGTGSKPMIEDVDDSEDSQKEEEEEAEKEQENETEDATQEELFSGTLASTSIDVSSEEEYEEPAKKKSTSRTRRTTKGKRKVAENDQSPPAIKSKKTKKGK